jgi:hypothetical protein
MAVSPISLTDGEIEIDVAGTPTSIREGVIAAQLNITGSVGEFFTLDSLWAKTTDGGIRADGQIECLVEASATSTHGRLRTWQTTRGSKEMTFSVPDKETGSLEIVGEFRMESMSPLFQMTAGDGNPQKSTARIRSNGELAIAVIA